MATSPKVKFKTLAHFQGSAPLSWPADTYAEALNTQTLGDALADLGYSPTQDSHKLPSLWLILAYTTTRDKDTLEQYKLCFNATRTTSLDYEDKINSLEAAFKSEFMQGHITGYWLYGYKVNPSTPGDFELLKKKHQFQVTKKVFLNGPLKDHDFLQKNGKYHV